MGTTDTQTVEGYGEHLSIQHSCSLLTDSGQTVYNWEEGIGFLRKGPNSVGDSCK